jgi:hypothetical protein
MMLTKKKRSMKKKGGYSWRTPTKKNRRIRGRGRGTRKSNK